MSQIKYQDETWQSMRTYDNWPAVLQGDIKAYYDEVVQQHSSLAARINAVELQKDDNVRYTWVEKFIPAKRVLLR